MGTGSTWRSRAARLRPVAETSPARWSFLTTLLRLQRLQQHQRERLGDGAAAVRRADGGARRCRATGAGGLRQHGAPRRRAGTTISCAVRAPVLVHAARGVARLDSATETYIGWGARCGTPASAATTQQDPVYRVAVTLCCWRRAGRTGSARRGWPGWGAGASGSVGVKGPLGQRLAYRWADPVAWQGGCATAALRAGSSRSVRAADVFCDVTTSARGAHVVGGRAFGP